MGGFNADAGITLGPAVPLEVDQLTLRENQLNEEQKQIYGKIVEAVQHRETEHRASNTACACADVCNLAFISGVGGTGKSHLIETIVAKVCHQFGNDSVAVAAPTGLASLNISGVTLHKLLKLPVQHGVDAEFWNLGKPDVKSMRNFFKNVRVFIIDEISMVSNVVLAYCHARFNELFGIDDTFLPFGGVMLIVFGDLLQLPPVRSQFVFEPLSRGVIRKIFGGVDAGANLWHEFRYFELLHNMRQRDDLEYAEMLGRARVGCSTPEDVEKFEGRLVYTDGAGKFVTKNMISNSDTTAYRLLTMEEAAIFLKQLVDKDSTGTLALVPKNEACDAINNTILKESFSELYPVMPAEDSMSGGKRQGKKLKKTKASDTGGLPDELILGKGCRVMIRRNINQSRRLMNGSLGTLVDVKFKPTREGKQSADKLVVAIDGVSQPAKLDRVMCKFNLSKNLIYTRRQFPVIVAYAVTDHKSQALSLNTVLIDLGPDCFASGMAYVALSRCRRLSNVFLVRFDPKVVRCEPSCVKEYNRLRQKFTNLQKIAKYNTILNEAKKVRRSRVAVDRLLTDDIRTRDSRQSVTDIARKKKKPANAKINRTLHVPFPHFQNQQNSCYANSVVQSLMSINDEFFWPRLETFGDNPVCCELVKLRKAYLANNATPLSTDELRRSVGPPFNNFGAQDDAGMFLMTLIDKFPPDVKRHFLHDKVDMSKCLECNRWSCNPAQFQHDVCIWQSYPHLRCQFDDIIRNSQTQTLQCEHCRRRTEQTVSEFPMLTQTKHYFWIQLNFFQRNVNGQYERRPFSMQGMKSSGITLRHCVFDEIEGVKQATRKTFKPVSFVVHQGGNTPDSGHYTTWVKLDKNWCLISDDHVVKTSPMIPPGLHSCYLILMASS